MCECSTAAPPAFTSAAASCAWQWKTSALRTARAAHRARRVRDLRTLGSPEGELALAEAVIYLALAQSRTRSTRPIIRRARSFAEDGTRPVPMHLRNAPTA